MWRGGTAQPICDANTVLGCAAQAVLLLMPTDAKRTMCRALASSSAKLQPIELKPTAAAAQLTESLLTGLLITIFVLLDWIIEDLRQPFDGFWSIAPAAEALENLRNTVRAMKDEEGAAEEQGDDDRAGGGRRTTVHDVVGLLRRRKQEAGE